jgi:hypothetical protein
MKNGLEVDSHGNKWYWKDNLLHREDGPAVEYPDGYKAYIQNGLYHREDGPAIIQENGIKNWYLIGKIINVKSQKEFEQYIKLIMFI